MMDGYVIKLGKVESVEDNAHGLRIKARLDKDKNRPLSDIPYAFPLLPKTIQTMPKVNEGVFIITSEVNNIDSNRYYIGPVISQPQYQEFCQYIASNSPAISLLNGSVGQELDNIDNDANTSGSFPNKEDVALVGRVSEDVILKDGEVLIRSGIRQSEKTKEGDIKGNVFFNQFDPAYLQLKYKRNIENGKNSLANIVGDRINLMSPEDAEEITKSMRDNADVNFDELAKKLHPLPYGDTLLKMLEILKEAVMTHTHPYNMLPPYVENTPMDFLKNWGRSTDEYGLNNRLLSQTINIS